MRKLVCIIILILSALSAFGQKADLRRGNREFNKKEYAKADISYRKALMQDTASVAAHYNLANNLYRQENFDEAAKQLDAVQLTASEETFASDYYFNRGDVAVAKEDWQTAVNMFKEALRRSPEDLDAKENYLYARNKLQEQQQQQQQQNQDQNQEQNQDQNQNQDQDQNQDQNKDQDQQNQNKNQNQDNQKDQQQQPQGQQPQISPQQAQQMLQAIQEKEKQTQEKVDEKKAEALKSRQKEKNW